jgi:hypothetical protein
MRYVLFLPNEKPAEESVTAMFNAIIASLKPEIRPLEALSALADNEVPVLSAVYTGSDRQPMANVVACGRPYTVVDHTWFNEPHLRGRCFRVVANGFQPKTLVKASPDWQRYRQLGLSPVRPWQETTGKVLFLPHSERFGEIFGVSPSVLEVWAKYHKPFLNWTRDVTVRTRHSDAARQTPDEAILSHRAVMGFNSEMLIRALRYGVPAIGHPQGSVVYAFNGLTPEDLDTRTLTEKSTEERETFCATLATYYQLSLEDLATTGAIEHLLEQQMAV